MKKSCVRESFDEIVRQAVSDSCSNEDIEKLNFDDDSNLIIKCSVKYCTSNSEDNFDISFFRLPEPDKNKTLHLEWLNALNNKLQSNIESIYVCSKHFPQKYINKFNELKENALPSIFGRCQSEDMFSSNSVFVKSRRCWVPFCSTKKYYFQNKACTIEDKDNVKFHDLPTDKDRLKKWLNALNLTSNFVTKSFSICNKHFLETDYKKKKKGEILLLSAVPSQNLGGDFSKNNNDDSKSFLKRKLPEETSDENDIEEHKNEPIHQTRYQSKILDIKNPRKKQMTKEIIKPTNLMDQNDNTSLGIIQQINNILEKEKQNIKLETFQICDNLLENLKNNFLESIKLIENQQKENIELKKQLEKFAENVDNSEKKANYSTSSENGIYDDIEEILIPNNVKKLKKKIKKFKCKCCAEKFSNFLQLNEHYKLMHMLKCPMCEMKFKTDFKLIKHKLKEHILLFEKGYNNFIETCPYNNCNREYPMKSLDYYEHIDSHRGILPYGCCNYKFKYMVRFLRHLNKKDKIIKCNLENFTVPPYAPTITKSHGIYIAKDDFSKITCPICKTPSKDFSGYKEHIKSHMEPKGYKCSCEEIFDDLRALCVHLIESKHCSEDNCTIFHEYITEIEQKNTPSLKQSIKRKLCDGKNDKTELNSKKTQSDNENTENVQIKIDNKFLNLRKKNQNHPNKKSTSNYYKSKSEEISYSCLICIKRFTVNNFFIHLQQNDHKILENNWLKMNNVEIIICNQCKNKFDTIYNYLDHLITFHNEFDLKQNMKNVINNTENNSNSINNNSAVNTQKINLIYNNSSSNKNNIKISNNNNRKNNHNGKVIVINSLFDMQLNLSQ